MGVLRRWRIRSLWQAVLGSAALFVAFAPTVSAAIPWSIVSSPNTSTSQDNELYGVSCVSSSDCWATGYYSTGSYVQTLVEQYNGTSWSIVTSPNTSTTQINELGGVSCVSSSDCWAVGHSNNGSLNQTLVEQWNGSTWAIIASPSPGTADNGLSSVTCVTVSDCWAVGSYDTTQYFTLALQYNGSSWSQVSTPTVSSTFNSLNGVSCVGTAFCFAVGQEYTSGSYYETVTEEWNGSTWAIIASPNQGSGDNVPLSVTCLTASNCSAVGFYTSTSRQPLALGWNGTAWSIVSSSSPSTLFTQLLSVACATASNCVAVGYYSVGSYNQTLIEQYGGAPNASLAVDGAGGAQTCGSSEPGLGYGWSSGSSFAFSTVTLNGLNQSATFADILTVSDNSGCGSGWNVSSTGTTFSNGTQSLTSAPSFPAPSWSCTNGAGTCALPGGGASITYPYSLPVGTSFPTATEFVSDGTGAGMGVQQTTENASLLVPAYAYAGSYTATWLFTIAAGP